VSTGAAYERPTTDSQALLAAARTFANTLTETVWRTIGYHVDPFAGVGVQESGHVVVRQEPRQGITLTVNSEPTLLLVASYQCRWDHQERFLAVETSKFLARAISAPAEPLFRIEYLRQPSGKVPVAHMQVHAARDAWTDALTGCGDASRRAKRRGKSAREPQLSEVHFPLGGHRFRPCLEDVLEMLLDEFGVDRQSDAQAALLAGRTTWRRYQIAATVRDSPEAAATALEALGYDVSRPEGGPLPDREDRMGQY
jgi:hypothetical protein